jgi:hypothetical protein
MRVAQPIELNEEDRRKLEQQSRGRSIVARVVLRRRIILLAAEGLENKQIAKKLKVAPRMATLWRDRFNKLGIKGQLKEIRDGQHIPYFLSAMADWTSSSGVFRGRPRGPGVNGRWVRASNSRVNSACPSGRPVWVHRRIARRSASVSPSSWNLRQLASHQCRRQVDMSSQASGSALPQ